MKTINKLDRKETVAFRHRNLSIKYNKCPKPLLFDRINRLEAEYTKESEGEIITNRDDYIPLIW